METVVRKLMSRSPWSISLKIPSYPTCKKCAETDAGELVPVILAGNLTWHCTKCDYQIVVIPKTPETKE